MYRRFFIWLALVFAGFGPSPTAKAFVISNEGFEAGTLGPWLYTGFGNATIGSFNPQEGAQYANLGFQSSFGAESFTFAQDFSWSSTAALSLQFYAQRTDFTGLNDTAVSFEVKVDGTVLSTTVPTFGGSNIQSASWLYYDLTTPGLLAAGMHTLTFTFDRGATAFARGPSLALDNVVVTTAVPEPIAAWLLGTGAALWACSRRRQRHTDLPG